MSTDLYAWMADDQNGPGVAGIVAVMGKWGPTPMVMVGEEFARGVKPLVQDLAEQSGVTIRLVRYTAVEEIEVVRHG